MAFTIPPWHARLLAPSYDPSPEDIAMLRPTVVVWDVEPGLQKAVAFEALWRELHPDDERECVHSPVLPERAS